MGANHVLGWFGFKAVPDFCNCGSHVGALVGAVCGWCLLWKGDPAVGAMAVGFRVGTLVGVGGGAIGGAMAVRQQLLPLWFMCLLWSSGFRLHQL